jgi:hypothetical protein
MYADKTPCESTIDIQTELQDTTCIQNGIKNYCDPPTWMCQYGDGTCDGTCTGTCYPSCSGSGSCTDTGPGTINPNSWPTQCAGGCTANGGNCAGGKGSCFGGTVCFNQGYIDGDKNSIYSSIKDSSGICINASEFKDVDGNPFNEPSYFLIRGCSCAQTKLQQGNILGLNGYYMGSVMLNPGDTYELSFDYAVIENDIANNPTAGASSSASISIQDMSGSINLLNYNWVFSDQVDKQTSYTFQNTSSSSALGTNLQFIVPESENGFPFYINPNIQIVIYKSELTLALKNFSLRNITHENDMYGFQNQFPAIPTVPYTTNSNVGDEAVVWMVPSDVGATWDPSISSEDCPQSVLFYKTAQTPNGNLLGWPHGLLEMSAFHTAPTLDMISIVKDYDQSLHQGDNPILPESNNNVIAITVENINGNPYSNKSGFLMSNSYYGSGQWDIWVKIANVFDGNGNVMTNSTDPSKPANPTGCSFAFWVYHALSYEVEGGARLWNEPNPLRNTEIDIEMNGACPDYSLNYTNNVARLNGWGGQWGGSGANFTMHTQMPNSIDLNDGKYHKLSIIFHSGYDLPSNEVDPNPDPLGNYPSVRVPGFVKWLVDDVEWGCGWMGNSYGQDNVPMTATRIVAGPWNPDWAGCSLCCDNKGTTGGCNGCNGCLGFSDVPGKCCPPATGPFTTDGGTKISQPACNVWSEAVFYVAKMQFTPTCIDCELNAGFQNTTYGYRPEASSPSRPDPTLMQNASANSSTTTCNTPNKCVYSSDCGLPGSTCAGVCVNSTGAQVEGICPTPSVIPASNRNRWLPETKPYLSFPVDPPQSS